MSDYLNYRRDLKNGAPKPEKKKQMKIKPVSDKRAKMNKVYAEASRPFWKGQRCQINSPVCSGAAQGIHHRKGKATPTLLMDKTWWMRACNHCNAYVETHDEWARERGFKLSRYN